MADVTKYAKDLFTNMVREAGMPVTEAEMQAEWKRLNTEEGSLVQNDSQYSPFWRLVTAIMTKPAKWLVNLLINYVFPNSFLRFATGVYLDVYAWGLDLARKNSVATRGRIHFTRRNASGELSIPAGTFIETPPINGKVYRVFTLAEAVMENGFTTIEVPVQAEEDGEAYNLGPGYYSILSKDVPGIVNVANLAGWIDTPGADTELDESLRLRCRNQFSAVGQLHHDAAYKALISEFAGIRIDYLYFEKDGPRGPGTANCHVMIESGVPPQSFCDGINAYIMDSGNHGHGDDLAAMPITGREHALAVTVHAVQEAGEERREKLLEEVANRIRCAFRQNTSYPEITRAFPLSRFSFSRLGDELHDALPDLKSVEFHRGEDIVAYLWLPTLGELEIKPGWQAA